MSEAWVDDVVATLDRRIAEGSAQPDFLDVVSRARALDPDAFDDAAIEQAEAIELAHAERLDEDDETDGHEAELDAWIGDVRGAIERRVEERSVAAVPALTVSRPRRAIWWVGGALAAGLLLALGVGGVMSTSSTRRVDALDQAVHLSEPEGTTGTAVIPMVEPRASTPRESSLGVAPLETIEGDPEADELVETKSEPEDGTDDGASSRQRARRADRLARLGREAQEHWRAGRRQEATRVFEEIVNKGGRSRAAEMALADLFTLAYQLGDTKARRAHWRTYLRRFPRGRFVDDARAGLCRTGPSQKRESCWDAYLRDLPRGSYRAEARAAKGTP